MQPRYIYQQPKPTFGEILNANKIIHRDINKDLMMKTQQYSEVRNLGKKFHFQQSHTLTNYYIPKIQIQKY